MDPVENVVRRMTDRENKPTFPHELFENFRIMMGRLESERHSCGPSIDPEDIASVFKADKEDQENHSYKFLDPTSELEKIFHCSKTIVVRSITQACKKCACEDRKLAT